jgi:hypothetical protein
MYLEPSQGFFGTNLEMALCRGVVTGDGFPSQRVRGAGLWYSQAVDLYKRESIALIIVVKSLAEHRREKYNNATAYIIQSHDFKLPDNRMNSRGFPRPGHARYIYESFSEQSETTHKRRVRTVDSQMQPPEASCNSPIMF